MVQSRYKTVVDTFVRDIRAGRLLPGMRLPTHRQLAAKEHLSLVTATRVYAELQSMGLVSGETGRGTFVRETSLPPGLGVDQPAAVAGVTDLNFNYPVVPGQVNLLRDALHALAASDDLDALLRYQPHGGRMHERASVARHLASRGLAVNADQVLIVSGAQHGLAVAAMGLFKPGDVVAVDALTYPGFKVVAQAHRLELVPVPAGSDGPDLEALEKLCASRRISAVYTMPTMHNPLGWVMSLESRQRLVDIASRFGLLIIEDGAYAFLADNPPPPIASLAPALTVYVSGVSKSVATGLRVGFVAAPVKWVAAIEAMIRATTWNTPGMVTSIACRWIEDGTVALLEAQKREDARARQSIAAKVFDGMATVSHSSSYLLWVPLGEEVRADSVAMALLREQIAVSTAEPFSTSIHVPHALRLALASVPLDELENALLTVRRVIAAQTF